jgi:hypothetical protein
MTPKLSISPEDNRNKLILIGNGFDLAHGLETKYSDFLLWYLQNVITILNDKNRYEDILIKAKRITFEKLEIKSIKNIDLQIVQPTEVYAKIAVEYRNPFIKHLIELTGKKRWVDIEYEYFLEVTSIYKDSPDKDIMEENIKKLNDSFAEIRNKLKEYINSVFILNNIKIQRKIDGIIQKIDQSTKEKSLYFLNFNYTKTIQKYIYEREFIWVMHDRMEHKNEFKVINIHGEADDDDERNPIIFGYGDEMTDYYRKLEEININELTKNFKTFHYFKTNNYQELSRFINSDHYDVYILGHSCGISDRVLLNSIFENENCNSIQIYHYQKKDGTTDYFEKTQEISRCVSGDYKNDLRTKVVPFNENDWMSKEELHETK